MQVEAAGDTFAGDFELIGTALQELARDGLRVADVSVADIRAHGITVAPAREPAEALAVAVNRLAPEQYHCFVIDSEASQALLGRRLALPPDSGPRSLKGRL